MVGETVSDIISIRGIRPGFEMDDVADVFGVPREFKPAVNVIGFKLAGPISPAQLYIIDNVTRHIGNSVDTSRPVIVGGRGPLWLYALLVHNLHYVPEVAVYDPRLGGGVIVSSYDESRLGKVVTLDGRVAEARMPNARSDPGALDIKAADVGDKYLIVVEPKTRVLHPSIIRRVVQNLPDVHTNKPIVVYGPMPAWLLGAITAKMVHSGTVFAVYDPKLKGAIVAATHDPRIKVGDIITVSDEEVNRAKNTRATKIISVVGKGDRDLEFFIHMLGKSLSSGNKLVLIGDEFRVAVLRGNVPREQYKEIQRAAIKAIADAARGRADYFIFGGSEPVPGSDYVVALAEEFAEAAKKQAPSAEIIVTKDYKEAAEIITKGRSEKAKNSAANAVSH